MLDGLRLDTRDPVIIGSARALGILP